MSNSEQDNRKDIRRDNIKKKKNFDKRDSSLEYRDQNKLKKQFKKQKEEIIQEELWEEWEDDIS